MKRFTGWRRLLLCLVRVSGLRAGAAVESWSRADGKRRVIIVVQDRYNARPATGHFLDTPMSDHRGWKVIMLKGKRRVSLGLLDCFVGSRGLVRT